MKGSLIDIQIPGKFKLIFCKMILKCMLTTNPCNYINKYSTSVNNAVSYDSNIVYCLVFTLLNDAYSQAPARCIAMALGIVVMCRQMLNG